MAADQLRKSPKPPRLLMSYFSSDCRGLRNEGSDARKLINPILQQCRVFGAEAVTRGKNLDFDDSLEWMECYAPPSRDLDLVAMQLLLSMVAIHATTDFTSRFPPHIAV